MGLREYKVDGKYVTFNKSTFKFLVTQKARRDGITKTKLEQLLAEQIGVVVFGQFIPLWLSNKTH